MNSNDIELRQRTGSVTNIPVQQNTPIERELPPQDRGKDAWLLLLGAFIVEGFVWGAAFSFGVFQEYYSTMPQFAHDKSKLPVVGTMCTGLMYLISPLALPLLRKYPHRRRQSMMIGTVLTSLSFVAASFSQTVTHLILTQGMLVGIASSMVYYPVFSFLNDWFARRIGFAYGVSWASAGLSGFIFPYIFHWLLESYGFRSTLRIWAVINISFVGAAITVLKPRIPHQNGMQINRPRFTFAKHPTFVMTCIGNMIQGIGFFLPGIYLPSYAIEIGLSNQVATSTVSVLNIGTFIGFVCGGYIIDRSSSKIVAGVSSVFAATSVLLWWFSAGPALLLTYSLLYSIAGACYAVSWTGTTQDIVRKDMSETKTAEIGIVYAFFIAGRGIGNVISGPISQALLQAGSVSHSSSGSGFNSPYGGIIIFTAISAAFGGLGSVFELIRLK